MENNTNFPPTDNYKRAIRWNWLTKYYDILIAIFMREKKFRTSLVNQFINKMPDRILDVGCGTATLTIQLKQKYTKSKVTGIDGDKTILAIAKQKIENVKEDIDLVQALAYSLPFEGNTFDAVTSSLMFHHLADNDKIQTLKDIFRILKVNGEIHIADWGKASNFLMRGLFHIVQIIDGYDTTTSNVQGKLPLMMEHVGFKEVKEVKKINTVLGTVSLYQGIKL